MKLPIFQVIKDYFLFDGERLTLTIPFQFLPDYSSTEYYTGRKWLNGKKIYQKTINFGYLPNTTSANVPHNISNLDKIIHIDAVANNTTSGLMIDYKSPNTATEIGIIVDSTNVTIGSTANVSSFYCYVTLAYTKT